MARGRNPTGLPIPRSEDADTRRFFELVSNRLGDLNAEVQRTARQVQEGRLLGGDPDREVTNVLDDFFEAPSAITPIAPTGFEALGGIGFVMLNWDNPFRHYANHAHTNIYRSDSSAFDRATQMPIAEAPFVVHADRTVVGGQDYYYWITWETTEGMEGPAAGPVMATPKQDPREIAEELTSWLTRELVDQVLEPPQVNALNPRIFNAEIRSILSGYIQILSSAQNDNFTRIEALRQSPDGATAEAIQALITRVTRTESSISANSLAITSLRTTVQTKADASALDLVATDVQENGSDIMSNSQAIQDLRSSIRDEGLGPPPNLFTGATRSEAEEARDRQSDMDAAWLNEYNTTKREIELKWSDT